MHQRRINSTIFRVDDLVKRAAVPPRHAADQRGNNGTGWTRPDPIPTHERVRAHAARRGFAAFAGTLRKATDGTRTRDPFITSAVGRCSVVGVGVSVVVKCLQSAGLCGLGMAGLYWA
jgi:hypothetical protein